MFYIQVVIFQKPSFNSPFFPKNDIDIVHKFDISLLLFTFNLDYGSTSCQVFKWGVQNWNDFCLKINIIKVNY